MKLIQKFLTQNDCYKTHAAQQIRGVMLHSVGCACESAENFISSWNKPGVEVCVHAFCESGGDVYQTLPWAVRGWHAGKGLSGSANDGYISVEMTEPKVLEYSSGGRFRILDEAYAKKFVYANYLTAAELISGLCAKFGIDPLEPGALISHSEGHALGIASNHGDVEHLWCRFGITMDDFRVDVNKLLKNNTAKLINALEPNEISRRQPVSAGRLKSLLVNGKLMDMECIFAGGKNYIALQELKKLGIAVSYESAKKLPVLNSKKI